MWYKIWFIIVPLQILLRYHPVHHDRCNNFLFRLITTELGFTMTLLNLDRFLLACSPVFYEEYFKVSTMKKLTCASLFISFFSAAVFSMTPQVEDMFDYEAIVVMTLFCLLFCATCLVVAGKTVKSHHLLGLYRYYRVNKEDKTSFTKDFLVCFLVSLTFIAFYCIPGPWYLLHMESSKNHKDVSIFPFYQRVMFLKDLLKHDIDDQEWCR